MIANKTILYPRLVFAQMSYAYSYFRSNVLKFRRSNVLYFGAQTSFFFRSNVLSMRSNVHWHRTFERKRKKHIGSFERRLHRTFERRDINLTWVFRQDIWAKFSLIILHELSWSLFTNQFYYNSLAMQIFFVLKFLYIYLLSEMSLGTWNLNTNNTCTC